MTKTHQTFLFPATIPYETPFWQTFLVFFPLRNRMWAREEKISTLDINFWLTEISSQFFTPFACKLWLTSTRSRINCRLMTNFTSFSAEKLFKNADSVPRALDKKGPVRSLKLKLYFWLVLTVIRMPNTLLFLSLRSLFLYTLRHGVVCVRAMRAAFSWCACQRQFVFCNQTEEETWALHSLISIHRSSTFHTMFSLSLALSLYVSCGSLRKKRKHNNNKWIVCYELFLFLSAFVYE